MACRKREVPGHLPAGRKGARGLKGRNPTMRQKAAIDKAGLKASEWLVIKNLSKELHLKHRYNSETKVIPA
ncbi:DUF6906 family protein [Cohnella xylanilytica]|uniref:DUF6906 family protein n=1 Tax=Cohnella xylanilytica TaxID=557555 RepID=UPI0035DB8C6B